MDAKTLADNLSRVQTHLQYEVAQTRGLRVRVAALEDENALLREENRGLRVLLKSPYQGEYAYDSDAAIDAALAERDPAHER